MEPSLKDGSHLHRIFKSFPKPKVKISDFGSASAQEVGAKIYDRGTGF